MSTTGRKGYGPEVIRKVCELRDRGMSISAIAAELKIHESTVSRIYKRHSKKKAPVKKSPKKPSSKRKPKTSTKKKKRNQTQRVRKLKKEIRSKQAQSQSALMEENEYLRWCNQGERRGWVDRLLEEIQG